MKNQYILKDDYAIIQISTKNYGLKEVLIDLEDVEKCKKYSWQYHSAGKRKNKCFLIKHYKIGSLKNYLLNYPKGTVVINKNNNIFDCRKNNLIYYDKFTVQRKSTKKGNEYIFEKDIAKIQINSPKYGYFEAIIDIEDYEKVKDCTWGIRKATSTGEFYVSTTIIKKTIRENFELQNFLLGKSKGMMVDHIDHNTLNNRRSNLRLVSSQENARNRMKYKKGYIGVTFKKKDRLWVATIKTDINTPNLHLGCFKTEKEAVEARRQAELKYWGEEALKINDENRKRTAES